MAVPAMWHGCSWTLRQASLRKEMQRDVSAIVDNGKSFVWEEHGEADW